MSAFVQSRSEIEAFRSALLKFSEGCRNAIDDLNCEVRRAADWLEHDRPAYWKEQVRLRERAIHDAKLALDRCLIYRVADERPMCQEERVALRKAETRLASAKDHVEKVRHWRRRIQHEQQEMEGRLGQIDRLVESEIPRAVSALDRILDRLEAYTGTRTTGSGARPAASRAADRSSDSVSVDDPPSEEAMP